MSGTFKLPLQTGSTRPVYSVWVANKGGGVYPSHFSIVLPRADGLRSDQPRDSGRIFLEDHLPRTDEHHAALGIFIDAFGAVEAVLHMVLSHLVETDSRTGFSIANVVGTKQVCDMITTLATRKLPNSLIAETINLIERVSKLTSKRNMLVHGHWTLELVCWVWNGQPRYKAQILRVALPMDYRLHERIIDLRNQEERHKFTYNVKRIYAAANDAIALRNRLGAFMNDTISPLLPLKRRECYLFYDSLGGLVKDVTFSFSVT